MWIWLRFEVNVDQHVVTVSERFEAHVDKHVWFLSGLPACRKNIGSDDYDNNDDNEDHLARSDKRKRNALETPGVLKSALDEQNDKFVVQVLDWAGKMDGISLKLSDGRFSTWIVECEDDLRDDLKYASYKKSIINIAKYKVKKGSIIKIVDYDVIEENGE